MLRYTYAVLPIHSTIANEAATGSIYFLDIGFRAHGDALYRPHANHNERKGRAKRYVDHSERHRVRKSEHRQNVPAGRIGERGFSSLLDTSWNTLVIAFNMG